MTTTMVTTMRIILMTTTVKLRATMMMMMLTTTRTIMSTVLNSGGSNPRSPEDASLQFTSRFTTVTSTPRQHPDIQHRTDHTPGCESAGAHCPVSLFHAKGGAPGDKEVVRGSAFKPAFCGGGWCPLRLTISPLMDSPPQNVFWSIDQPLEKGFSSVTISLGGEHGFIVRRVVADLV